MSDPFTSMDEDCDMPTGEVLEVLPRRGSTVSTPRIIGNPGGPSRIRDLYHQGRSLPAGTARRDPALIESAPFFPLLNAMCGLHTIGLSVPVGFNVRSDVTYVAVSESCPHVRDLIDHPQYEPESEFPW